jgi:hypothetical protein
MCETHKEIMCKRPYKQECERLLNETIEWERAGSETTYETDDETKGETHSKKFDETCRK